jgi:hypothetical protein
MKLHLKERIKTKIFWIGFLLTSSLFFGIAYNIWSEHWIYVAIFIPWIPLIAFFALQLVFAWIVNPIRWVIEKRKKKKEDENVVD